MSKCERNKAFRRPRCLLLYHHIHNQAYLYNGKEQYVELASSISYVNAQGKIVNVEHAAIGNNALAFVGTSGVQLGWLASQADMLAEDWKCVE